MNKQRSAPDEVEAHPTEVIDLNERNWLPRHCSGDPLAFEQLLRSYSKLVYTFLYRYGIEAQHRDDLFQDIFLKIHQSAQSYRPSAPLRPWLVSIVLNTVRNFRRDRGRRTHFMTQLKVITGTASSDATDTAQPDSKRYVPGLDEQMEQQSTVSWLQRRISTLPGRQREVLVLATFKGLSMKEIALILKLPENTVKTHLRRARLALAEDLASRDAPAASMEGNSL